MMKSLVKVQRGFTLIELLIVIAVLGVLAAVVLAAINPLEQLKKGRDSGRISGVAQLGHAMEAYVTGLGTGVYPVGAASWQTNDLVTPGEIGKPINVTQGANACNVNLDSGFCYTVVGTTGMIWTDLESANSVSKGGCAGATPIAVAVYDTSQGKAGIGCVANATATPQVGIPLK